MINKIAVSKVYFIINFVLSVTLLSMWSCTGTVTTERENKDTCPASPVSIDLSFPHGAPPLYKTAELVCTVKTVIDLRDISVKIKLPEAFELVSDNLSWSGNIPKNSEVEVIKATIKSVKTGDWTIESHIDIDPAKHGGFGGKGHSDIYVLISERSAVWNKSGVWSKPTGGVAFPQSNPLLTTQLVILQPPPLHKQGEIIFKVTPTGAAQEINLKDTKINFLTSLNDKGLKLVSGAPSWSGDIPRQGMQLKWVVESIALGEWIVQVNMECYGPPSSIKVNGNEYEIRPKRTIVSERLWIKVNEDSATVHNYMVPLTPEQQRTIDENLKKNPPPPPPAAPPPSK